MTTRTSQLMDLYSDYLIVSFGQTSATGMARLMPELSHDQVTRFLAGKQFDNKGAVFTNHFCAVSALKNRRETVGFEYLPSQK